MAKKSLSKKSLKSLFSRSEANLDESVEKDASKNEGEKKKFKFFKLKTKSKNSSSPEKAGHGSQQVLSAAEPSNTAGENEEAWTAGKKSVHYSTAPRSKGKEFSYSEMDLRKPKRFATFSFGLKKRKRKDEDNLSKSTFGLHSPGIGEHDETNLDLSQVELDHSKTKMTFSMSQPELDTSDTFDIPSPPAVGKNQSGSPFTIPNQPPQSFVSVNTQPESKEPMINSSAISVVCKETPKAPIASIQDFQLDNEELNAPVHHSSSDNPAQSPAPVTHTESISVVDTQPALCIPANQLPVAPDTLDQRAVTAAAAVDHCDNDTLQQPYLKTEISLTDSTNETLSNHQPDAPDIADSAEPSDEPLLTSADSKPDATSTNSAPVPRNDSDISAHSVTEGVSDSHVKRSAPEAADSVTTALAISSKKTTPRSEDAVYGALYESLFPESFTSEIMSSLSALPPQIHSEVIHVNTKPEPIMVKILDKQQAETTITYSRLPSSHDSPAHGLDRTESGYTNTHDNVKVAPTSERFTSYQTSTANDFQADTDQIQHGCPPSSLRSAFEVAGKNFPYSELTNSEVKLDSSSPIHDNVGSVPVSQNSAPPASDYVTSQGTDTQVTDSKRRVILVKELVSDEASLDSGCPSPVPDKMSAGKGLELKIEAKEGFHAALGSGPTDLASPVYLSVGSDDGSVMEIYYSAEEDNTEESGEEEMYTIDEREETYVVDGVKEMERGETAERDERGLTEVNVRNEETIEAQQHLRGQWGEASTPEFHVSSDAEIQEKEMATTALPLMTDEKEEGGREEELLATPVQPVNTLMVCEVSPPSSGPHVQGEWSERNRTGDLETEDHLNGERQLPCQETRYAAYKDSSSAECTHAASSNTSWEDVITPTSRETAEQVSLNAEQRGEETNSNATTSSVTHASTGTEGVTGVLTHCTELQSNTTETEHNRAPQSSEWADTVPQYTNRKGMVREQVAVELSDSNTDAPRPDTEPAEALSERREHPAAAAQSDLNQGFLTASGTTAAASEVLASEGQETEADQGSVDKMSSGYSSLSTKLTIKTLSPSKEDESRNRFRKVSLIAEGDGLSQDTVELTKTTTVTESNGEDLNSEYKWKNRFEDVSPYVSQQPEYSSLSDSERYTVSDTYSPLPETTTYKPHSSTFSSSFSSSPASEEDFRLSSRLSERTTVYLNHESEQEEEPKYVWRRSRLLQEEPAAPAGEGEGEAESERIKSHWETQQLPVSGYSSVTQTSTADSFQEEKKDDDSARFTGLFKATFVELDSGAAPSSQPASPDTDFLNQSDMDNLVDTLKSMGPSMRPRSMGARMPPQSLISSLPPIVEDAHSPGPTDGPASHTSPMKTAETTSRPAEAINGGSLLPADLGLKRSTPRDTRSPLELMKKNQQDLSGRGMNFTSRVLNTNSIGMMRASSDSVSQDTKSPVVNGNGLLQSNHTGSRLDTSVIFGGFKLPSLDQTVENGNVQRPLYRSGSLPETGLTNERMSTGLKQISDQSHAKDAVSSRFERFSFFLNSSSSGSGSLTGAEDPSNTRISRPPSLGITSPTSNTSPSRLLSPTGSKDIHRSFATTDSPLSLFGQTQVGMAAGIGTQGTPILQRSFSNEGTMGVQQTLLFNSNNVQGGSPLQSKEPEPEKNILCKYRAFPDAYLTKEKEHGKLNPRPGKMYIFDRPGMCGQRVEVRSDVIDATAWDLQETISIRVVRGGWVLYEKPNFKGEKIALDEGDIELTFPFGPPEEPQQNGQKNDKPAQKFIIGSIRRAVRDYSVPEISLFPEANAEGKKVIFRDTSDDARIFGFPIKATSIIINAGLWLVYAQPFFQGVPRVLEVGGYTNPAAWGVEKPYVGSLHPLKIAEPRVENMSEPKIVIFEKPYFSGKSRTITTNMKDFMTRTDQQQTAFMYSVGSIKVMGGIWVGYEKEGFRGHQYLLEEGEHHDWRVWGGHNSELRSVRVIKADLTDPMMVMFEQLGDNQENMEENTFEVTEAIPDVELFEYKTSTRSIHVLSGAWIAYSHVDFSGDQYILEKGFYNNCADWGSADNRICSVQPILLAPGDNSRSRKEIILYSEPNCLGECHVFDRNQEEVPEKFLTKSCQVVGGNWVVYQNKQHSGDMYVLSEGEYPNLTSMGCPSNFAVRSVKVVPMTFAVPSVSLFGLEGLEGREITTETEIINMAEEGFNNHILSVRVNSGSWVICEHSNYRGRQFLLETIEIPNWPKFSSLNSIGSIYPVRQKRHFFRIKNKASGFYMSIQGGLEEMKSGRVVATAEVEPMSDIWFYQEGLIKNKLSHTMCLQVMGNVELGAKVVMWSETRHPIQTWEAKMRGLIPSLTFPGMVLDIKGGKTYDRDHVVIMPETEEKPSQQWELELL